MGEVINLRTVRKRKAKADQEEQAAENRAKFGVTKAEKAEKTAKAALEDAKLDGHKRDD